MFETASCNRFSDIFCSFVQSRAQVLILGVDNVEYRFVVCFLECCCALASHLPAPCLKSCGVTLLHSVLSSSVSTLLRSAFGDFDYNSVVSANRVLGPVFFFMWLLYAAVILLNMAIAIISESFVKVRHRAAVRVRCGFAVAVCSSDVLCFGQFSKTILFWRHAYLVFIGFNLLRCRF